MSATSFVKSIVPALAIVLYGGAGDRAFAAEKVFRLPEAVTHALENNEGIKALRADSGLREAAKIRAGLRPNPSLEFGAESDLLFADEGERSLTAAVSQEFLTGGKTARRRKAADLDMEAFAYRIADAERILAEEVEVAFYDFLLAERRAQLAGTFVDLSGQLLQIARERLDAGDIPELEADLARVEAARAEGRKIDAERELDRARSKISSLMGLPPGTDVALEGSLEAQAFVARLEDLKASALVRRPDLLALAKEMERADAEILLAEAESIPDVTASVEFRQETSALEAGNIEVKERDRLLGLKLSVPLPLFDRNQAARKEAVARRSGAASRYRYARDNVEREVESAFARLVSSGKSVDIYRRDIFPRVEENLRLTREAYRLGEVGILSAVGEQRNYLEVSEGYLAALHQWNTAAAGLKAAAGGGRR